MQTFLPYANYTHCAKSLDNKRLGKQRVEAYQILLTLMDINAGWKSHPAVKMWENCEFDLCNYGLAVCSEWIDRGFKDNLQKTFLYFRDYLFKNKNNTNSPKWLGNSQLHISHQSNLKRKDLNFYSIKFPNISPDLPYFWPIQ